MNGTPNKTSHTQMWTRRAMLRRAGLGAASLSILGRFLSAEDGDHEPAG